MPSILRMNDGATVAGVKGTGNAVFAMNNSATDLDETLLEEEELISNPKRNDVENADNDETILLSDDEFESKGTARDGKSTNATDIRQNADHGNFKSNGVATQRTTHSSISSSTSDKQTSLPTKKVHGENLSNRGNVQNGHKEGFRKWTERFDEDDSDDDMDEEEFLQAVARRQAERQALLTGMESSNLNQSTNPRHSKNPIDTAHTKLTSHSINTTCHSSSVLSQSTLMTKSAQNTNDVTENGNNGTASLGLDSQPFNTSYLNESFSTTAMGTQPTHQLDHSHNGNKCTAANASAAIEFAKVDSSNQKVMPTKPVFNPYQKQNMTNAPMAPKMQLFRKENQGGNPTTAPLASSTAMTTGTTSSFTKQDTDEMEVESDVSRRRLDHNNHLSPENTNWGQSSNVFAGQLNQKKQSNDFNPHHKEHESDQYRVSNNRYNEKNSAAQGSNGQREQLQQHRHNKSHDQHNKHDHNRVLGNDTSNRHVPQLSIGPRVNNSNPGEARHFQEVRTCDEVGKKSWEEDAFRCSLVDLLNGFPVNYLTSNGDRKENNSSNNKDNKDRDYVLNHPFLDNEMSDETPSSVSSSQKIASTQIQQKRLFDAASRSLARLAIASRHGPTKEKSKHNGNYCDSARSSGPSGMDIGEHQDNDPPSPRSLPSFMSVLNAYGGHGVTESQPSHHPTDEIFTGHSVHGLNARTVRFWNGGKPSISTQNSNAANASAPTTIQYSSWTMDELVMCGMKLAARVCYHFLAYKHTRDGSSLSGNFAKYTESCRVAGFSHHAMSAEFFSLGIHSAKEKDQEDKIFSPSLVESSLEFLATSFACLESDLVYSALKARLLDEETSFVSVFDVLACMAPTGSHDEQSDRPTQSDTISMLALVSLSRGLSASQLAARFVSSMNPHLTCSAQTSAYPSAKDQKLNGIYATHTDFDEKGVGWFSAVGTDLGFSLEEKSNFMYFIHETDFISNSSLYAKRTNKFQPRHMRLRNIAGFVYDFILDYDPKVVNGAPNICHDASCRDGGKMVPKEQSSRGLFIDTSMAASGKTPIEFFYRQPLVVSDRVYSAYVEYLSSLMHLGIISGWLTNSTSSETSDYNGGSIRTVERLCQKLFYIIETRSRLRQCTNQNSTKDDPGDTEAVCAASLSLLILALPPHIGSSSSPPLQSSFRQMGSSTGTLSDLFQSPLMQKLVKSALTFKCERAENDASTNATRYVVSDIVIKGCGDLLLPNFREQLTDFIHNCCECICQNAIPTARGRMSASYLEGAIYFLLFLHTGCPVLVRQCLRNFLHHSTALDDNNTNVVVSCNNFMRGLLFLCANKSFSMSIYSSMLLRALLNGNPFDQTQDLLSELLLRASIDSAFDAIEAVVFNLVEMAYSYINCDVLHSGIRCRWQLRLCSLTDVLSGCFPSLGLCRVLSSVLSTQYREMNTIDLLLRASQCDSEKSISSINTLRGSAALGILFLLASFVATKVEFVKDDDSEGSVANSQRAVKEILLNSCFGMAGLHADLEAAMVQGKSADMTHRALNLQAVLSSSFGNAEVVASSFTRANSLLAKTSNHLQGKLEQVKADFDEVVFKYDSLESERDKLGNTLKEQSLLHERQLEWARSETQRAARNLAEIHVEERRRAEENASQFEKRYHAEKEARVSIEQVNSKMGIELEQMKLQRSDDKAKIKELECLLEQERKLKQEVSSALDESKSRLSYVSDELQRTNNAASKLESKLALSEETVSDLIASKQDAEISLEQTCAKLIKLAFIYQNKESEMEKYKTELRNAVNTANRHADTAISKYEAMRHENASLSKQLAKVTAELNDMKSRRAEVQRQRRHAPTSYINRLHSDPTMQENQQRKRIDEKHKHKQRSGKENSFIAKSS